MTVLITITDDETGRTDQCDARCYNAKHPRCKCVCKGVNHGVGLAQAEDNTRARDWSEAVVTITGQRPPRIRLGLTAGCNPLFPVTPAPRQPAAAGHAPAGTGRQKGTQMSMESNTPDGELPDMDLWYCGRGSGAGPRSIVIETGTGEMVGVVAPVGRGGVGEFSWGYGGAGPSTTARSLLIAALGADALCRDCNGTGRVVCSEDPEAPPEPFDPAVDYDPECVTVCPGETCEGGYRVPPGVYQDFKAAFVAGWGPEWRIPQRDVRAWVLARLPSGDAEE